MGHRVGDPMPHRKPVLIPPEPHRLEPDREPEPSSENLGSTPPVCK